MKTLLDNYHQPQNCGDLMNVKVNLEIWAEMKPDTKAKDVKVQKLQGKVVKAVATMATVTDGLIKEKATAKGKSALALAGDIRLSLDVFTMMGSIFQDLHVRRCETIKAWSECSISAATLNAVPSHDHVVWRWLG